MRPPVGTIFLALAISAGSHDPPSHAHVCEDNISYKFIYLIYKIHFSLLTLVPHWIICMVH